LGEASGTSFADSSGNGNTLTLTPPTSPNGVGGTYDAPGDVTPDDGAYQFNFDNSGLRSTSNGWTDSDANGLLLAPHMQATMSSGYPSGTNSYSLEAWVKPEAENPSSVAFPEQIIGNWWSDGCVNWADNEGTRLYYLQSPGNTEGSFVFERASGDCTHATPIRIASVPVPPDQWYYVVATFDGGTMRLYVDDTRVTEQPSASFSIGNTVEDQRINVGNGVGTTYSSTHSDISGEHFKGTIDEAAVYSYALLGSQVQAHYAYGLSSGNSYSNPPPIPTNPAPVTLPITSGGSCGGYITPPSNWAGEQFTVENYHYYTDEGYILEESGTGFQAGDAGAGVLDTTTFYDPFFVGWYPVNDLGFNGLPEWGFGLDGGPIDYYLAGNDQCNEHILAPITVSFKWVYTPPLAQENGCDANTDGVNDASFFGDVNSLSGAYATSITDIKVPSLGVPLTFTRCYSSAFSNVSGPLGPGWKDSFSANLAFDDAGDAIFTNESGQAILFYKNADGSFTAPAGYSTLTQLGDGTYRLTRVNGTSYHFDANGNPLSEADRNGQGLTYSYSGGQLTTVTDQTGRTATLAYTGNLLSSVTYSDGRSVGFGYTSGLLTSFTDVRGKVWHYAYDGGNRLASIQDPLGHFSIRNTYDSATGRVTSQEDANNQTRTISVGSGGTTTLTDPNQKVWTDKYQNNELVSRTDPLGDKYTYTYDDQGNRLTSTDPNGNTTTYSYDSNGNMLSQAAPASLNYQPQTWTYNSMNEVTSHTDARGHETDYGYDAAGNLTSIVKPGNLTTTYNRNPSNPELVDSMVNARDKTTHYTYDGNGNLASVTDPDGNETTYTYDSAGDKLTVTTPRGNVSGCGCASQYTTTTTYDNAGHKRSVTDPLGNETTYTYDDAGNLATMVDAVGNAPGGNPADHTTTYAYDNANELTTVTRPGSPPATTGYNSRGLVTSRTSPLGRQTTYGYDEAGHLTSIVSPNGNVTGCNCASQFTTTYSYDANGNRAKMTNPLGGVTKYAYDPLNRLIQTTAITGGNYHLTRYSYDANGNRVKTVDPMGRVTTSVYDANNHRTSRSVTNAPAPYVQTVLASSPDAYFRLGESSGTTATNVGTSGSAENGTYSSGNTLGQPGAIAGDADTAMSGNSVTAPTYAVPNCTSLTICNTTVWNGTFEFWSKRINSPSGALPLYVNGSTGAGYGYGLYQWSTGFSSGGNTCQSAANGQYMVGVWVSGDSQCILQAQVSMNLWHHIVVTHSGDAGAGGVWSLYVDGRLAGSVTSISTATGEMSNTASQGNLAATLNNGWADELAFYQGSALSAGQVLSHYASGLQSVYAATAVSDGASTYWRLDEPSGTTATNIGSDGSNLNGANHNGTYSGATLGQPGALFDDTAMSGGTVSGPLYAIPSPASGTLNASLEGWFNLASQPSSYGELLGNGDSNATTGGYGLYDWTTQSGCTSATSGNYMVGLFVSGATNCALQAQLSLNAWHYIALTHSGAGTTGTWSLYVDGALASSVTSSGPSTGAVQHVPSTGSFLGSAANGTADELAFYKNVTLSANQIANHYQAGLGTATRTTSYTYDNDGNQTSVADPRNGETTYNYDDADRLTSSVSPLGNVNGCGCASQYTTSYGPDPDGNQHTVTDPNQHTTTTNYNADEQAINFTDAAGRETQWQYDPNGNLTAVIGNYQSVIKYAYNALNQQVSKTTGLTSISDPGGNTTTYFPDADGMLTKTVDPLGNAPGGTPANYTTSYTYDADGNRLTTEDAIANAAQNPALGTTTDTYNALDEPTQISYSDGTHTVSYSYDSLGDLLSRTDSTGVTNYGYNADNQVTSAQTGSATFSYGYDGFGELNSETYPNGTQISYGYDNNGNLNSLSSSSQTTNYVYDADNQLTSESMPNGYTATMSYDNAGQLASVTNARSGTTLSSYNVTARYNDGAPQTLNATNNGQSWVENYTYDQDGRLASVCYQTSCPNGSDPKISWVYDASGNRISESRANSVSTAYTYNAADELTNAVETTGPVPANPYPNTVQTDGAQPYFRVGETSGSSFNSTVGSFAGTWTGSPTLGVNGAVAGDSNGAVTLNGTSQYGSVPNSSGLGKTSSFSVELWAKQSKTGVAQPLAGKPLSTTTTGENYAVWLDSSNRPRFDAGTGSKSQSLTASSAPGSGPTSSSVTLSSSANWDAAGMLLKAATGQQPALVQQSKSSFNATSGTLTLQAAPTNGNVLVLAVGGAASKTVSSVTETGVTWTRKVRSNHYGDADIWIGTVGANASAAITVTMSASSAAALAAAEFNGVTTTTDGTGGTANGSTASPASPSVTPTGSDLALSAEAWQSAATINSGPTNGYTLSGSQASGTTDSVALSWAPARLAGSLGPGWHQIVGTFSSGAMKLYIDGSLAGSVTATFTSAGTNTGTLDIGRNSVGTASYYGGSLDELSLYNTALSATQVQTHYTQATTTPTAPQTTMNYTYNKDGEETNAGNTTYGWNLAGDMTSATVGSTTTNYTYDGAGMRTSAVTGGSTINYTWDETAGGLPTLASETDGNSNPLRTYLYGASSSPVSMTTPAGSYYYSYDSSGNASDLTDASGATQWAYSYEPFGLIRNATNVSGNAPTNPYQYAGQYTDTATGLSDMRARNYDPNTGAFLSTDPVGETTTLTSSPYAYAGDLPLIYSDPSGLCWQIFQVFCSAYDAVVHYGGEGLHYVGEGFEAAYNAANDYVVQPTIQAVQNDVSCLSHAVGGSLAARACISGAIGTVMFLVPEARGFAALTDIAGGLAFRAAARAAGTEFGQSATSSLFRLATEENGGVALDALEGETKGVAGSVTVGAFDTVSSHGAFSPERASVLAAEDVAAGAQSNFMGAGERFAEYASRAEEAPGYHDVIVHGTPSDFGATGDAWTQGRNFSHRALTQMLERDPSYEGGPVRLLSCSTGGCGATAAQNLANKLGVEVMAPTDTLWAFRSGRLVVGPEATVPTGGWAYFFPGGS
jgi:RHS repeat-associated protein